MHLLSLYYTDYHMLTKDTAIKSIYINTDDCMRREHLLQQEHLLSIKQREVSYLLTGYEDSLEPLCSRLPFLCLYLSSLAHWLHFSRLYLCFNTTGIMHEGLCIN